MMTKSVAQQPASQENAQGSAMHGARDSQQHGRSYNNQSNPGMHQQQRGGGQKRKRHNELDEAGPQNKKYKDSPSPNQ
jgi:hypothetical protein